MAFPSIGTGTGGAVSSVNGMIGNVVITAASVGLGSVDNTADIDKIISDLTNIALDTKRDKALIESVTYNTNGDPLTTVVNGIEYTYTYNDDQRISTVTGDGIIKTLTWDDDKLISIDEVPIV